MRLKQIHIYGYGKLNDIKLDNLSDMQLFYGENEAGKSTIMSFIHSILFGFPTLQQSELRYEPKTHSSYGGKLVLETDGFGEVVIERVKGKAAGDVTVLLEDGAVEAEEFLPQLQHGTDKTMYRSIFSFDLQGLQEIQRLKEEEIGKYLIAAGTVGTDDLLRVEQQLQKELDQLFKPGGRKPILNEQLKNLRRQEQQLKKAKKESTLYESLLADIQEINNTVETAKEFLYKKRAELDDRHEMLKKWPLLKEQDQIKKRLFELADIDFPTDGLKRLEKYNDRLLEISSNLKTLNQRIETIEIEIKEKTPLQAFDPNTAHVFISEWPRHRQNGEELSKLDISITANQKEAEAIIAELHYPAERADAVQYLNLGIDMKARMKETIQQYIKYEDRLKDLKERLENESKAAVEIERKCAEIESQFVSESKFKDLKRHHEMRKSEADLEEEKIQLEKEIRDLENRKKREEDILHKKKRQSVVYSSTVIFIFSGLLIWGFLSNQWLLMAIAIAGAAYAGLSLVRKVEGTGVGFITESLKEKRERLRKTQELLKTAAGDIHNANQYKEQLQLREKWKEQFSRLEEQRQRLEETENLLQRITESFGNEKKKLDEMKADLGLDKNFSHLKIEDAFLLLKQLQQLDHQMKEKMEQKEQIQNQQKEWEQKLFTFLEGFNTVIHEPAQAIFFLQETMKKEQEKEFSLKELHKNLSDLNMSFLHLQNEESIIRSHLNSLFKAANVKNEEDLRKKAKLFEEKNLLKERLALLDGQLGNQETNDFQSREELQDEINRLNEEIEEQSSILEKNRDKLASLNQEVRFLEEGGTYTENLHLFRQMRSVFNTGAHTWAELAVTEALLKKVMAKYKESRFPKVIRKAEEYFSFLTDNEYTRLHFHNDGDLAVERKDRVLFAPGELSRGTGEQLFIAIRLGLVHALKEEYPFPVIIDDGFVNFDHRRTERMLDLIQKVSSETQVLLFTCHQHIAERFSEDRIIKLRERLPQTN